MMDKKNFCFKIYPANRDLARTWFVKFIDQNGRTIKKYGRLAHFHTVDEKLKEAARIIAEIENPFIVQDAKRAKLVNHLSAVLEYRKPALEKKSYETYFSIIKNFAGWYHPAYKADKTVNPADFIRYLYGKNYSNATIRKSLGMIKDFFKVLVKQGHYFTNPFEDIRVKKIKGKSLLPFHPDQIIILKKEITTTDPQLWDAVLFEYYLYFRPAEIRQLKICDILFDEMKIILRDEVAKDDDNYLKVIPVPMQPVILNFRGYDPNFYIFSKNGLPGRKPLSRDDLSKRHLKIRKKLGLSNRYAFYSWVHTGIKMAAMAGVPLKQLQIQKGHSDLNMFNEYMKNLGIDDCVQLKNNFPAI